MNPKNDYLQILNSIRGLFVIDKEEKIIFMSEELYHTIGYTTLDDVLGRSIREVLQHNNAYKVLQDKKHRISDVYFTEGYTIVSNSHPILNGEGEIVGALEYDLFQNVGELQTFLKKISNTNGLSHYSAILNENKYTRYSLTSIKGSSPSVVRLKEEIALAAKSNSTVLITGETGTGKELAAQSIHELSQRSLFNFMKVNCAAFPSELFESEVFGYEEGSFTGAKKGGKVGLAQVADKGTLFLDEIDSLPLHMQAKILRFIQDKEILKVGGSKPIPVDVRIIAASNRDLLELVKTEQFRKDLYYRLHVIEIPLSPLRERKSDIPELVNNFIQELNLSLGRSVPKHIIKSVSNEALKLLMSYHWPGNIRELHNAVERAMNRCYEEVLQVEHFQDALEIDAGFEDHPFLSGNETLEEVKCKAEYFTIRRVLQSEHGNVSKAAERLGITRQMLYRKLKKYSIDCK